MAKSIRRPLTIAPKQLDYAALVAKGYAGSEFDAHLESGEYREGAGDVKAALGHYLAAIDLLPTSTTAYRRAGELYYRLGYFDESQAMLLRAYTQGDGSAELACSLGLASEKTGQLKQALAHFDRSLKLQAREAKVYHYRGSVHRSVGNLEAAVRDFEKAIELEPRFLAAIYDLARVQAARQHGDEALGALKRLHRSKRWLQRARREADFHYLRQFPSFWGLLSGKLGDLAEFPELPDELPDGEPYAG